MKKVGLSLAVLLLAALLRIYHLNDQGLWGDEGWSVEFSEPSNPADVTRNLADDLHPPLYFISLSLWRQIAGDTEIAMRLWAVFPALLTVALIERLGRQVFSPAAGIFAALVLALADKHIVLAQEVRHYPLAFMWMALTSLAFLRWIEQPNRTRTLHYALLIILGVYTHYYTALILLVQIVYAAFTLRPWQRVWRLVVIITLSMLAFVPWMFVAYHQLIIRPEGILHSMALSWDTLDFLAVDFLGRPVVLLGSLLVLGLLVRRRQESYATLWFTIPIVFTLLVYPFATVLTDRNMALLLLPIALLAGYGTTFFQPPARLFLAFLVAANGLASLDSYHDHPPWREMATYVADNYPAGEPVLMDVVGGDKALNYHLHQLLPDSTPIFSLNQWRIDYNFYFLGVFNELLEENDGFWIAYWVNADRQWDVEGTLAEHGYVRTASQRFYHLGNPLDLYHYDRIPALDETVAIFGDDIRLHRVKAPATIPLDQSLNVSLWWSTTTPLPVSYSVSVFLLDDAGQLRTQHDGPPQNGQSPTNSWQPDQVYFDSHRLSLAELQPGSYRLAVKVYNSANGQILSLPDGQEFVIVGEVLLRSR